jgi:7,8-dihydropterin-6-yl-methyl-4-(beta-D-ribofuranosyl)aminobenzene 5'-phosphate synthase
VFARPADNQRLLVGGPDGIRPDPFRDELALLLETKTGHVVVSGCSHRGIGNIIKKARDRVGSVAGVIGGFHLHKESDDTIRAMAEAFRGIPRIFAGHCTGGRALEILEGELGQGVVPLTTGLQIEIP